MHLFKYPVGLWNKHFHLSAPTATSVQTGDTCYEVVDQIKDLDTAFGRIDNVSITMDYWTLFKPDNGSVSEVMTSNRLSQSFHLLRVIAHIEICFTEILIKLRFHQYLNGSIRFYCHFKSPLLIPIEGDTQGYLIFGVGKKY